MHTEAKFPLYRSAALNNYIFCLMVLNLLLINILSSNEFAFKKKKKDLRLM